MVNPSIKMCRLCYGSNWHRDTTWFVHLRLFISILPSSHRAWIHVNLYRKTVLREGVQCQPRSLFGPMTST